MFDLSVVASEGRWLLLDEAEGQLGDYGTKAEALKAWEKIKKGASV